MKIRFCELAEPLREGGLEKAAADMATYLNLRGVEVVRSDQPVATGEDFDLVHFHGLWSFSHYKLARRLAGHGIPYVVSPHGMLEPWAWRHRRWKKFPYFHLIEKHRLRAASSILATAGPEAQNIRGFFPSQPIDILPLGIETDYGPDYESARQQLQWKPEEKVLLYLSRVHPKKGLAEMLKALISLGESLRNQTVRLVILGDGPVDYMDACRQLVNRLQGLIQVDWLPPQWGEKKWPYLQGSDLFCLPTYSENFGIVVLEAGIVGTPVFTTTGTPWKEVEEAGFGWVPDPDPAGYADVLREFLEMPISTLHSLRQPFADWTASHYAWPNLVDRYIAYYESVIKGGDR
jgi:glycosyltransferase involved in cell wall biosynthesis